MPNYEVPGVELISQDKNMACWFASAMMVLNWKERYSPGDADSCIAPDDETMKLYAANKGLQNPQIIPLAKRLGLVPVPPMSPSVNGLTSWLQSYGPLWTNGRKHIVVIAGIRQAPNGDWTVKVYDPWPGTPVGWRSLSGWYAGFDPKQTNNSTRDSGSDVEAVFLHA